MPKQRGATRLQGADKSANKLYYRDKKGVYRVRELAKPGIHKDQPALKANYTTIGEKNKLGGKIGRLLKFYAPAHIELRSYDRFRKVLQKDPVNGRYLQLKRFEGADGHSGNKLDQMMKIPTFSLSVEEEKVIVSFDLESHPQPKQNRDHYFLRIILVLWNTGDDDFSEEAKRTHWVRMDAAMPLSYDMEFKKPKESREYMLLCCLERGEEAAEARLGTDKYIRIVKVGSFDEADEAAYAAYREEKNKQKESIRRNAQEEEAVAPIVREKKGQVH